MNSAQSTAEGIINPIDSLSTDPSDVFTDSRNYLRLISGSNTPDPCSTFSSSVPRFDANAARQRAAKLEAIGENPILPPGTRSKAYLLEASIMGLVVQQGRHSADGKIAFDSLKSSIQQDPNNTDAINAYARTLIDFKNIHPSFFRWVVIKSLGINLQQEAATAAANVERVQGPSCLIPLLRNN